MRTRVEANRTVHAILSEVCEQAGIAQPRLVLDMSGPDMTVGVTGRPLLRYPMHCARTESEDAIRGTVAHEVAHAVNGDTTAQPLGDMLKLFGKVALLFSPALLCGVMIFFAARYGADFSVLKSTRIGWSSASVALLVFLGLLHIGFLRWPDFVQYDRPRRVRELRADLTAVSLVGREPVLAFLHDMRRRERITIAGRRGLFRVQASGQNTHPETDLRIEAVEQFEIGKDPDTEAVQFLHAAE